MKSRNPTVNRKEMYRMTRRVWEPDNEEAGNQVPAVELTKGWTEMSVRVKGKKSWKNK